MQKLKNYIGGELVASMSGEFIDNFDPSTGLVYSQIADSDERDVESAVEAAKEAFSKWSQMSAEDRFTVLMRIVALIEREPTDRPVCNRRGICPLSEQRRFAKPRPG